MERDENGDDSDKDGIKKDKENYTQVDNVENGFNPENEDWDRVGNMENDESVGASDQYN